MVRIKSTFSWAKKHAMHMPGIRKALAQPMVPEILNSIDAHQASTFFVLAPAQVFKSLIGQLYLLRSMQIEPKPTLWYGPTDKMVEDFVSEKLNPLLDSVDACSSLLFDDPHKRGKQRISLPSGDYALLLSIGADANRNSKTARDILFDEPWLYDPGWIGEAQRRRSDFPTDFREVYMTTGPIAKTEPTKIWENTDKKRWYMRCPKCQGFFETRFDHKSATGERLGGVIFESVLRDDGLPDEAAIWASAVYQCPLCKVRMPDSVGSRLALNGTSEAPRGVFVAQNSRPSPKHFGFQVNGCALREWGDLAVKFVVAQLARERGDLEKMSEIVRLDFADIWDDRAYFGSKSSRHIGAYKMGDEWAGELKDSEGRPFRFATVDVQTDCYYLLISMWGRFSECRTRLAVRVMSVSDIEFHCKENLVIPQRVFMDARYEPQRVRRIASLHGWMTMMGDKQNSRGYKHEDQIFRIYDQPKIYDPLIGTPDQGHGNVVIEILFSKQAALNRLHLLRTEKYLPRKVEGQPDPEERFLWSGPANPPDWFWTQMDAHYRKKKVNPDGSEYWMWEGMKDDHIGDCWVMAIVAASIMGLTGSESMGPQASGEPVPAGPEMPVN